MSETSGDAGEERSGQGNTPEVASEVAPQRASAPSSSVSMSQLEFAAEAQAESEGIEEDELTPIISIEAIPGRASEQSPPIKVLGSYEILKSIGSGGMAEVF